MLHHSDVIVDRVAIYLRIPNICTFLPASSENVQGPWTFIIMSYIPSIIWVKLIKSKQ